MSCLIIAGEKSGEEHVLSFYDDLAQRCPGIQFYGVGGDDLIARGFEALYHLRDFSSMGFIEPLKKLGFYRRALKHIEDEVECRATKTAILVDFQEFNMRLAKCLKQKGVKVLYYVAPQAWAWRPGRARILAQTVHTLFTILPFEREWFIARGVAQIKAVEHSLLRKYRQRLQANQHVIESKFPKGKVRILLLPGSRVSEVSSLLPEFLWAISHLSVEGGLEVGLVKAHSVPEEVFACNPYPFHHVYGEEDLANALEQTDICLACSGTVTLCSALFQVPTIVAYKMSLLNEALAELVVRYHGPICLANIVHSSCIFPEFIQLDANGLNFLRVLKLWLTNNEAYETIRRQLKQTTQYLSGDDFNIAEYMSSVIHGSN